jgi:hypothetical protein
LKAWLFSGTPDFDALLAAGPNVLTAREQAFLDNEVTALCALLDDFAIDQAGDLPAEVWAFMRDKRFFGMIIPEEWGGLGFSHYAHATVVTRIATLNISAAVTVMVPNSWARPSCCCATAHAAKAALPAAPGRRPRPALLRADLALCGLRRRVHPRPGRSHRARNRWRHGARL